MNIENVADVTVYAEENPIVGNIICAKVILINDIEKKCFTN